MNKAKLNVIIRKKLAEGYLKIVKDKPDCIHGIRAVPKPDEGIRPITAERSMPKDISVNNFCDNVIEKFQYKSVDQVLAMLQEGTMWQL